VTVPGDDGLHAQELVRGDATTELASSRTAMAFERTALATHRTLQSTMRTSLSLIAFGFSIFQFFAGLSEERLTRNLREFAARDIGLMMVVLGILILMLGIVDHYLAMRALRERKRRLANLALVHTIMPVRFVSSMAIAISLLLIGVFAFADIVFTRSPG
jgi:putative membrane protein